MIQKESINENDSIKVFSKILLVIFKKKEKGNDSYWLIHTRMKYSVSLNGKKDSLLQYHDITIQIVSRMT